MVVFFCFGFRKFTDVCGNVFQYAEGMQALIEILVVSSSRTIREGLQSLALALPQVNTVHMACCDLRSLPKLDQARPALILLECTLPMPGYQELLAQIKLRWPNIKVVVLVDTEEERLQLDSADVDIILLKGAPAARLSDNLKRLLSDNASSRPSNFLLGGDG